MQAPCVLEVHKGLAEEKGELDMSVTQPSVQQSTQNQVAHLDSRYLCIEGSPYPEVISLHCLESLTSDQKVRHYAQQGKWKAHPELRDQLTKSLWYVLNNSEGFTGTAIRNASKVLARFGLNALEQGQQGGA
jgi:hypothetical protein